MRQRVVGTILVMLALVIHSSGQDTKNTTFQGSLPQYKSYLTGDLRKTSR
ncbi:MAG: hypothetical protein ACYC46_15200 [Acidobacteriaceae bacterium]